MISVNEITYQRHFYPRSPCGERQCLPGFWRITPEISIHALLAESDRKNQTNQNSAVSFLSTLSLRRATLRSIPALTSLEISIHALLAESDEQVKALKVTAHSISIHALLAESDTI